MKVVIEADYSTALNLLIRYPTPTAPSGPSSFVKDALLLRSTLSPRTGSAIIEMYSGKTPTNEKSPSQRPGTQAGKRSRAVSHSLVPKSLSPNLSPAKFIQEQGGIEAIVRGAAKGAYARSEQWGVNRAFRGAMQNLQSAGLSPQRAAEGSRWSLDAGKDAGPETREIGTKLEKLQNRNLLLANLVGKAMDDLWTQQRRISSKKEAGDEKKEDETDNVSLAIAKLQFIQVYLENPSMPLTAEDETVPPAATTAATTTSSTQLRVRSSELPETEQGPPRTEKSSGKGPSPPDSPTHKPISRPPTKPRIKSPTLDTVSRKNPQVTLTAPPPPPSPSSTSPHSSNPRAPSTLPLPRPSITQSSFSWILDTTPNPTSNTRNPSSATQNNNNNNTNNPPSPNIPFPTSPSPKPAQHKNARQRAAYLFGDIPNLHGGGSSSSGEEDIAGGGGGDGRKGSSGARGESTGAKLRKRRDNKKEREEGRGGDGADEGIKLGDLRGGEEEEEEEG